MCREAGIEHKKKQPQFACHWGNCNVPGKLVREDYPETTGHHSIEALCLYERISTQQHQAVSRVLMSNWSFEIELEPSKPTLVPIAPVPQFLPVQFSQLFGSHQNCTIVRLMVNVNPAAITVSEDKEFKKSSI